MRSKASYFSISKPLIIENLRRFWAIPALAFLVYFLSGVFPILMSYSHLNDMASYIRMSLANQQPFYMLAHLMFPIIAAVVIFRYLQGVSSVSVMHSMPFTRAKLYNSSFLSGLILIAAPILANGLILLAISKPVYRQYGTETGLVTDTVNLFARADILNWIWVSLIIAFVSYAVAVFAGIVTGNGLMHFATAIWFNFLIPALYAVFIAYFSHYLYGFDTSANWAEFGMKISPFLNVLQTEGKFGVGITAFYIANFLALYGITGFLYQKRKLERATDSLVFTFMEPIICYLIAFLGMTLLGFYFEVLGESELYFYGGLAAGTVIFFIIGQMIVKKTPRIYNMKSLKSFGIYALIAVLFLIGLNFDVTGFERRIPSPDRIAEFTINEDFAIGDKFGAYYWNSRTLYRNTGEEGDFRMKDAGNIDAVVSLHRSLIDNKGRFEDLFESSINVYYSNVYLRYNPDSAIPLTRRYRVDYDFFKNSPDFKKLYESKEFKDHYSPLNLNYISLTGISISNDIPFREAVEITNQADIHELMACLDRDFQAQTFEDMVSLKRPFAEVAIRFKYTDENSDTPERPLENSATYRITESYANTIQWLADHGYKDRFMRSAADVEAIELFHYIKPEDDGSPGVYVQEAPGYGYVTKEFVTETEGFRITDPDKIQKLLDTYETRNINYDDYYYGVIFYKGSEETLPDQYYLERYGYIPEPAEKYRLESSAYTVHLYFNEGNIPDYVLEYFKNRENK